MGKNGESELPPEVILAIRDEVTKTFLERSEDDRVFIKKEMSRIASVTKYVGAGILAIIAILGFKTIVDVDKVIESTVLDRLKNKDLISEYKKPLNQLYAKTVIASGLSSDKKKNSNETPITELTDTEYKLVLDFLLGEKNYGDEETLRVPFDQGVLLLSQAPDAVWKSAAAKFSLAIEQNSSRNWSFKNPDYAITILDAFIKKRYSERFGRLRSLIMESSLNSKVRIKLVDLARTIDDKESYQLIEKIFEDTQDEELKGSSLQYLIEVKPESKTLLNYIISILEKGGDILGNDLFMSRGGGLCDIDKEKTNKKKMTKEIRQAIKDVMLKIFETAEISLHYNDRSWFAPPTHVEGWPALQPVMIEPTVTISWWVTSTQGGTVYEWPISKCGTYLLSALRDKLNYLRNQSKEDELSFMIKTLLKPKPSLWSHLYMTTEAIMSGAERSSVIGGFIVKIDGKYLSNDSEKHENSDEWVFLTKPEKELLAHRFQEGKFLAPVPLRGLSTDGVKSLALFIYDAERKTYRYLEEPSPPTNR